MFEQDLDNIVIAISRCQVKRSTLALESKTKLSQTWKIIPRIIFYPLLVKIAPHSDNCWPALLIIVNLLCRYFHKKLRGPTEV